MNDASIPGVPEGDRRRALLFDIQRFCLHDGPGIRTVLFFKGCALRCAWCHNPESHRPGPEVAFFARCCVGCLACRDVCPKGAILAGPGERIDRARCDGCGLCTAACLTGALRRVGRGWGAEELAAEILRDRDFFAASGGGVTLSGGEAMLQAAFLEAFLPLLAAQGIHVTLETCGHYPFEAMERIAPFVDLVYFDLKLMDPGRHEAFTTRPNGPILANFRRLAAAPARLQPRMPVIPGINDDPENIRATAALLKECGLSTIHCLPYHRLGEEKRRQLGMVGPCLAISDRPDLGPVIEGFAREEIHVVAYD